MRGNRPRDEPPPVPGTNGTKWRFYCGIKQETASLSLGQVPVCPREGSQGRFLFVPDTVPPKMFMFIGFLLAQLLSGPLRLRVQSRSRTRLTIAASIAFLFQQLRFGVFREGVFQKMPALEGQFLKFLWDLQEKITSEQRKTQNKALRRGA